MAESGDLIREFKDAKPAEKVVIVVGIVAVAGVAFYLYQKGRAQAQSTPAQGPTGQVAGYPTANGVPVLPSGVNPVYDPNGNLVGYQNPATPGPTPTPGPPGPQGPPGQPGQPANWFTNIAGKLGYNAFIRPGGYDVNGQRFWIGKTGNSSMFYAPIGSTISPGAQGRVWLNPGGDMSKHVLLTGPGMQPSFPPKRNKVDIPVTH